MRWPSESRAPVPAGAKAEKRPVDKRRRPRRFSLCLPIENHGVAVEIGESEGLIPIHFAYRRDINLSMRNQALSESPLREVFDTLDLAATVGTPAKVRA